MDYMIMHCGMVFAGKKYLCMVNKDVEERDSLDC